MNSTLGRQVGVAKIFTIFMLSTLCVFPSFGWGKQGHELIATVGSDLTAETNFFSRNRESMRILTNVPDAIWKTGSSRNQERPNHWFEPDSYYSSANDFNLIPRQYTLALRQYGLKTLSDNGLAPWRILQTYDLLVVSLRARDFNKALQMAGVMSHYIGDLSQPLHVTKNFDGQETGQNGLHAFFESTNISNRAISDSEVKVKLGAQTLLHDSKFVANFSGSITDIGFFEVNRAYARVSEVIDTDKKWGRTGSGADAQYKIALERLNDGAATLAMILNRAWKEAGLSPGDGTTVNPSAPEFVVPEFYDEQKAPIFINAQTIIEQSQADDCDQP